MKSNTPKILAAALLSLAVGCAGVSRPKPFTELEKMGGPTGGVTSAAPTPAPRNDGSLFTQQASVASPWTDDTAHTVGDIVTVRISINNQAQNSASTGLKRSSNINAGITSLFGYEGKLPLVNYAPVSSGSTGATGTSSNSSDPYNSTTPSQLLKANSTSDFDGSGDTARTGKMVAEVSAMVTQLYPNGNMAIHGSQGLLINNETSILTVDGVIRPSDVTVDNIVSSDRIANARVEITGRGVVSDKQRPGILMRAFDWVWPF